MPSLLALEEAEADKNAHRPLQAIGRELDQIVPSVADWVYCTDSYKFIKGEMPEYLDANLDVGTTLAGMKINFLGRYDSAGKSVWTQGLDLGTGDMVDRGVLTGPAWTRIIPYCSSPA